MAVVLYDMMNIFVGMENAGEAVTFGQVNHHLINNDSFHHIIDIKLPSDLPWHSLFLHCGRRRPPCWGCLWTCNCTAHKVFNDDCGHDGDDEDEPDLNDNAMMTASLRIILIMIIRVTVEEVRVLEPLIIFSLAYLSYITAGMFSWSPIISLIGCGLVQVLIITFNHRLFLIIIIIQIHQTGTLRLQKHQLKISAHCEGDNSTSQLNKVDMMIMIRTTMMMTTMTTMMTTMMTTIIIVIIMMGITQLLSSTRSI